MLEKVNMASHAHIDTLCWKQTPEVTLGGRWLCLQT